MVRRTLEWGLNCCCCRSLLALAVQIFKEEFRGHFIYLGTYIPLIVTKHKMSEYLGQNHLETNFPNAKTLTWAFWLAQKRDFVFGKLVSAKTLIWSLLSWIGIKVFEKNPPEPTLIHIHWCLGSENLLELKSFNQGFFDWIKILDFLIVKSIVFLCHF